MFSEKGSVFSVKLTEESYEQFQSFLKESGVNTFLYPKAEAEGASLWFIGTLDDFANEIDKAICLYTGDYNGIRTESKKDNIINDFSRLIRAMKDILPLNTTVCGYRMNRYNLEYCIIAPCSQEHRRIIVASSKPASANSLKSCLITANLYIREYFPLRSLFIREEGSLILEASLIVETGSYNDLKKLGLITENLLTLSILRNSIVADKNFKSSLPVGYCLPVFANLEYEEEEETFSVVLIGANIQERSNIINIINNNYSIQVRYLIDFKSEELIEYLRLIPSWEPKVIGSFRKFNLLGYFETAGLKSWDFEEFYIESVLGVSLINDYIADLGIPRTEIIKKQVCITSEDFVKHIDKVKKRIGVHDFPSLALN